MEESRPTRRHNHDCVTAAAVVVAVVAVLVDSDGSDNGSGV